MKCCFCGESVLTCLTLNELLRFKPIIKNECCNRCYNELRKEEELKTNVCVYCKKSGTFEDSTCQDCQNWQKIYPTFLLNHEYLYHYNEKMKEYFRLFKFIGNQKMSRCFSYDINNRLSYYKKNDYLIIPIPISDERLKIRGFNQVEELLKSAQICYKQNVLEKKETDSQSEKNKIERLLTPQSFTVNKSEKKTIKKKRILLIDDVYTTGRTILHAYDCLFTCKPLEIRSFSLAR